MIKYDFFFFSENLQTLQIYKPTGYSLQTSPTLQSGYPSSLAKPIARPAAYHPHHPPHPPGPPAQHHFPSHPHHTLQLLACQGPYITGKIISCFVFFKWKNFSRAVNYTHANSVFRKYFLNEIVMTSGLLHFCVEKSTFGQT